MRCSRVVGLEEDSEWVGEVGEVVGEVGGEVGGEVVEVVEV